MGKEILATKVLPFLLPLCIEQNLSMSQYETLSMLVVDMINRVTSEHREALRQLDAVRRETQQLDQALSQVTSATFMQNNSLNDISLTPEVPASNTNSKLPNVGSENGLTIEDKFRFASANLQKILLPSLYWIIGLIFYIYFFRLIQQQETHQRLQSQSILIPKTISQPLKPQPKDLTATLLKNNLDELNLSMSKSTASQPDYVAKSTVGLPWNNNVNQMQPQFLISPTLNSQTLQASRPMNWNSNGINASMNWNSQQSAPMWSSISPQNNMNFTTQQEIGPSPMNFPGALQPFASPINRQTTASKTNSSTQDIMDLLS